MVIRERETTVADLSYQRFEDRFQRLADVLEQDELRALLDRLVAHELNAGETLITAGTDTDALFLVWDGALEVAIPGGTDPVVVGRGDYLGEVTLLSPGPATASVHAIEPTTVLSFTPDALEELAQGHPEAAAGLLGELVHTLARRVRRTTRVVAQTGPTAALPIRPGSSDVATCLADLLGPSSAFVGALAELAEPRSLAAGELVGRAGTRSDAVYLVLRGALVRRLPGRGDREEPADVMTLGAGWLAGAEALVGTVLAGDVVAAAPTEVAALSVQACRDAAPDAAARVALHRLAGRQLATELRSLLAALEAAPDAGRGTERTEVAVIGAGPLGAGFAAFLADGRPRTSITVLERRAEPGYKIGESTLGTTTRWLRQMGLPMPVLRRIFGIKSGIRFWWTGPGDTELHRHVDAGDVDETFQVERRVLETALVELMRRRGVDVRLGTRVNVPASTFDEDRIHLRCEPEDGDPYDLIADLACDASGPASVLPRRFGVYRRAPERHGTFNTNSYYAYYRPREDAPVPHWNEPATRHICFSQGWCWFITVVSWEQTPQENLEAMIAALLDHPEGPDESYPSRRELEERFGCRSEVILSVGFTVRGDRDSALGESIGGRFTHYLERYPTIARILDHYELIETPYGKRQPYSAFQQLAHDATRVAGDRWCAVGDAASFTNPLFSPGLNFGTGTAYEAAQDAQRALRAGDLSQAAFRGYQHYADRMHETLMAFNDMLYRSFAHPETFERVLAMFLYHSASDVLARDEYSETDPYVWDLLNSEFRRRVDEVRHVLRIAEERGHDPATAVGDVRAITDAYIGELLARPALQELELGPVLREFDERGERAPVRYDGPPGPFTATRCPTCRQWHDAALGRCPVCGFVDGDGMDEHGGMSS